MSRTLLKKIKKTEIQKKKKIISLVGDRKGEKHEERRNQELERWTTLQDYDSVSQQKNAIIPGKNYRSRRLEIIIVITHVRK